MFFAKYYNKYLIKQQQIKYFYNTKPEQNYWKPTKNIFTTKIDSIRG